MEIMINRLKESISNANNSAIYRLSQLINTELHKRFISGELKGFFVPGQKIVFTDDDGCILYGEIASNNEVCSLYPNQIFVKEVDPKTGQNVVIEDEQGNYLISGAPMMNEAELFKYILNDGDSTDV